MGDELLKLWRETGATVLLITHSLDEAAMLSDRIGVMSARPGVFIDLVETGWPRERDSRIVSQAAFGEITGRIWVGAARSVDQGARDGVMTRAGLDPACPHPRGGCAARMGVPLRLCQPRGGHPADRDGAGRVARARARRKSRADILLTLENVALSLILSLIVGSLAGLLLHRLTRLRRALDPLLASYYAVPTFVFYPLFIVLFGLNRWPLIAIGFLFAVVAVIINTLDGLARIPRAFVRTAAVMRLTPHAICPAHHPAGRRAVALHRREIRGRVFVHRRDRGRVRGVRRRHGARDRVRLQLVRQSHDVRTDRAAVRHGRQHQHAALDWERRLYARRAGR